MGDTERSQALGFLTLPAEIRLVIYSVTFGHEETALPRWPHGRPPRSVQLLRTCRTIYNEARQVLYAQTTLVLNGRGLHPFPTTVDRYMKDPDARNMLRNITILEPRIIPYRYKAHLFPPRKRVTDWNFTILRYLPGVRTVTITDVSPIPIVLADDVTASASILAVEHFISYQMSRTLLTFKDDKLRHHPNVNVYASARINFERSICTHRQVTASSTCMSGCVGEVVVTVRVYPTSESQQWDQDQLNTGRDVLRMSAGQQDASGDADAWFPVRCL